MLLRIEDIDISRCPDALVAACEEDLAWLGLNWEKPVLRQSMQYARYQAAADDLSTRGLLYPCFCSRGDIARRAGEGAATDPDGAIRYPGTCRALSKEERAARVAAGEAHAMRLDLAAALSLLQHAPDWQEEAGGRAVHDPRAWGDVILLRKDIPASYHLAVVLDDAMQGVTHVVRGRDLYAATAIHRILQMLLGLPEPHYHHHPLLTGKDGRKLAKSASSTPLRVLRAQGADPADIRASLGFSS